MIKNIEKKSPTPICKDDLFLLRTNFVTTLLLYEATMDNQMKQNLKLKIFQEYNKIFEIVLKNTTP